MTDRNTWAYNSNGTVKPGISFTNGIAEHSDVTAKGSSDGAPVQPTLTYEEICDVLALQNKVDLLTAENLALKIDNNNLVEMTLNLEKLLQAKTEDLEDALESIESWEERCDSLESDKYDLEGQIESVRELLG